jgi:hypothetical protein
MAKYGKKAQEKVGQALHEMKKGKLKSGKSQKKVTSRKQAIAIGLSQARKAGGKAPLPPGEKKVVKKKATKSKKAKTAKKTVAAKKRALIKKKVATKKKATAKKTRAAVKKKTIIKGKKTSTKARAKKAVS